MKFSTTLRGMAPILVLVVGGCGGGSSSSNDSEQKATSVKDALSRLESAGALPALDRTASVPGNDANRDGIRDDVERYVNATAYTAAQKVSMRSLSRAMTSAMTATATDEAALRSATAQMNNAVACVWKTFPPESADAAVLEIRKVTVNTQERYTAYMQYNAAVAGTVVKLPKEVNCE